MEKTPQRGKTQKTNGRKILQNTPEKPVKTHAKSHEKRQPSHATRQTTKSQKIRVTLD
jgi:hypothetical protein